MEVELKNVSDLEYTDVKSWIENSFCCEISGVEELRAYQGKNFCIEINANGNKCKVEAAKIPRKIIVKVVKNSENGALKWNCIKHVMNYLGQQGFNCTKFLPIDENMCKIQKNGDEFLVLLLEYIPGIPLMDCWTTVDINQVIKDTGEMVANLHNSLETLDVSVLRNAIGTDDPWILDNAAVMLGYLDVIKEPEIRRIITAVIDKFCRQHEETKSHLTKGIIHGDLSDLNLIVVCQDNHLRPLVNKTGTINDLFGIIDFFDLCVSCYIFEVAQVIRDFMVSINPPDCYSIGISFLSGYCKNRNLNRYELDMLFDAIMAGLCQYHVIGEYEFHRQPNNEYCRMGSKEASALITKYHSSSSIFVSQMSKLLEELNSNRINKNMHNQDKLQAIN